MHDLPAEIIYDIYQMLDYTSYSNLKVTSKFINDSRPKLMSLHKLKFKASLDEIKSIQYCIGVSSNNLQGAAIGTFFAYKHGDLEYLTDVPISYREYKNASTTMFYTTHKIEFEDGKIGCTDVLSVSKIKPKYVSRKKNNWLIGGDPKRTHYYYNRFYINSNGVVDIEYILCVEH